MGVPVGISQDIAAKIRAWNKDPVLFVRELFGVEPDKWQARALRIIARGGRVRLALKACAGPGKTAVLAWAGWWFLLCHGGERPEDHPNGLAISCDQDNLRDGLWKELARWRATSPLLEALFEWTKERIFAKDHSSTWFLSARGYAKSADTEQIGRTLSGLHGKNIFYLIDESGDMPVQLIRSAEQGLTDCECGLLLTAGNTTSMNGLLYFVSSKVRGDWEVITITGDPDDPERSPRVDIEWARKQIETYGRDNPWVMAYVLGQFPAQAMNSLLSIQEVEAAMSRSPREDVYNWSQRRLGVDVALYGDDRTVLFPRQGLAAFPPIEMRNAKSNQIAARILVAHQAWPFEVEILDTTGGWADGVMDGLSVAGRSPIGILFNDPSQNPRYGNKRSEMWMEMAEWVKRGGALPNIPAMIPELIEPTYFFKNGKYFIEPKELIKKRLGRSPDCFVAGTLVNTPDGRKPIESFAAGDRVSTPMGDRTVIGVWVDQINQITEVNFSNGSSLRGKGAHEVFTWGSGWVRLDALSLSNEIESDSISRRLRWAILRKLFTPVTRSGFKRQAATTAMGAMTCPSDFFIAGSGLMSVAQSLRVWSSITKMEIGLITVLKTWSLSREASTNGSIWQRGHKRILDGLKKDWLSLVKRPRIGIRARRGWSGIVPTGKRHGTIESQSMQHALSAGLFTKPTSHPDQDFVPVHASNARGTKGPKRALGYVCSAVRRLFSTVIANRNVVPVLVQTNYEPNGVKVYNLTLDADNAYYANGILVANCGDALALTFALPDQPAQTIEQRFLERSQGPTMSVPADYNPIGDM